MLVRVDHNLAVERCKVTFIDSGAAEGTTDIHLGDDILVVAKPFQEVYDILNGDLDEIV